jgi:hypothetical protein
MKSLIVTAIGILIVTLNGPAESRPRHHRSHAVQVQTGSNCNITDIGRGTCSPGAPVAAQSVATTRRGIVATVDQGTIIGSRPSDCPHAYCGCGLRKYLGLSDKRLNLAGNWAKLFPRAPGPAAGMAAVRSGHVMYIESSAGDGQWLVRDYNSGGGLSRLHVRDVRGYVFVNPHSAPKA